MRSGRYESNSTYDYETGHNQKPLKLFSDWNELNFQEGVETIFTIT